MGIAARNMREVGKRINGNRYALVVASEFSENCHVSCYENGFLVKSFTAISEDVAEDIAENWLEGAA